ncbi:MAG: nitrite/sulfite reductase [bacterium]
MTSSDNNRVDFAQDIEAYASDVAQFIAGSIPATAFKGLASLRGVYEQRASGTFMLRVRLTGGVLTATQARTLAELSRRYADGGLHVTTRQNIQFHGLRIGDTPEVMRRLRQSGLLSKGGGGNTVRTVVTCPYAGVCPSEVFDVTPHAQAITDYLLSLAGSYTLPRKYKIAVSGCRADCAFARATDLGCVAEVRDSVPGFKVYTGGGMGAHSRPADALREWIPATEIIRVAETVRRLFDRLGDRANRARARLRFAVERIGVAAFSENFDAELAAVRADAVQTCKCSVTIRAPSVFEPPRVEASSPTSCGLPVVRQHQTGQVSVPLHVPLGVLPAADLEALAGMAERFSGEAGLRATREQNLILRSVPAGKLSALAEALQTLSTKVTAPAVLEHFVSCTGATTCRLGLCWSRGVAKASATAIQEAGLRNTLDGLMIHASGCPNACGQHPLAAIGLCGALMRHEGHSLPAYKVMLGGGDKEVGAVFSKSVGTIPARAIPDVLVALLRDYLANHKSHEPFLAYVERQGAPHFDALMKAHQAIPSHETNPDFYSDWQ